MEKHYTHILLDLDRTLWDFDTNALEALTEILENLDLLNKSIPTIEAFVDEYIDINEYYWELYRQKKITKEHLRVIRFEKALGKFGIEDKSISRKMGDAYIEISPRKINLIPNTIEILDYLSDKYHLHIITNGFEEVQFIKMRHSDLEKYFKTITTSEAAGVKKPHPNIFKHALQLANAHPNECIMIGDDLHIDVKGAKDLDIHQVYFNPTGKDHDENPTHEIKDLIELKEIL